MAFKDENGRITIDEDAANNDIAKIRAAQERLDESRRNLKALISNAQTCVGETAEAICNKGTQILFEINRLYDDLSDTTQYIKRVVAIYRAKDLKLKAIMAAKAVK